MPSLWSIIGLPGEGAAQGSDSPPLPWYLKAVGPERRGAGAGASEVTSAILVLPTLGGQLELGVGSALEAWSVRVMGEPTQ